MLSAISTKYVGSSATKGSRILVRAPGRKMTVSYDPGLNSPDNHKAAAMALAKRLDWHGKWHGGENPEGNGYTFVRICDDFCEA